MSQVNLITITEQVEEYKVVAGTKWNVTKDIVKRAISEAMGSIDYYENFCSDLNWDGIQGSYWDMIQWQKVKLNLERIPSID